MPEWTIGAVSKTVVGFRPTVGSNPTLSADQCPVISRVFSINSRFTPRKQRDKNYVSLPGAPAEDQRANAWKGLAWVSWLIVASSTPACAQLREETLWQIGVRFGYAAPGLAAVVPAAVLAGAAATRPGQPPAGAGYAPNPGHHHC